MNIDTIRVNSPVGLARQLDIAKIKAGTNQQRTSTADTVTINNHQPAPITGCYTTWPSYQAAVARALAIPNSPYIVNDKGMLVPYNWERRMAFMDYHLRGIEPSIPLNPIPATERYDIRTATFEQLLDIADQLVVEGRITWEEYSAMTMDWRWDAILNPLPPGAFIVNPFHFVNSDIWGPIDWIAVFTAMTEYHLKARDVNRDPDMVDHYLVSRNALAALKSLDR